jgi:hypothetical protein
MPQILLRVDETECQQIHQKSSDFGLSKAAFIRQIMREYFRKPIQKEQPANDLKKEIRALIPVLAQAIGRTQNLVIKEAPEEHAKILKVSPEAIKGLSEILLKIYDQEVQ